MSGSADIGARVALGIVGNRITGFKVRTVTIISWKGTGYDRRTYDSDCVNLAKS
jgi:hypothetical protein